MEGAHFKATFSFVSLAGKLRFLTNLFILIFHFIYSFHMVPDYIKSGRFLRLCELVFSREEEILILAHGFKTLVHG